MKCYLCNSPVDIFLVKNGYTIVRCTRCELGRTLMDKNYSVFVKDHYNKGYFTGDPTRSAYVDYKNDKKYIIKNLNHFLQKVKLYKSSGRLLDVGCALGFSVELANCEGFDAYGFDASSYAVQEAQELNGKDRIQLGTIGEVKYAKKSFDIITMFDIFEHLADPKKDLQRIFSWLKDDGILIIATGNTHSIMARLLKRRWPFYSPPQHLFFFNKKNLTTTLSKSGFRPVDWFQIGKWLSFRYVLHLARTTGESSIAQWIYPMIRATAIGKLPMYLPLRDNMVVIARKNA